MRKERNVSFKVPDSNVLRCGTLSTGKSDFPQENNIAYIFRVEHWKEFWLFSKRYYLSQDPLIVVQFPPCNKIKRTFKFWISYYFSYYLELLFLSVISLLIFILYFMQDVSFTLCWKNQFDFSHSVCLFLHYLVHFEFP